MASSSISSPMATRPSSAPLAPQRPLLASTILRSHIPTDPPPPYSFSATNSSSPLPRPSSSTVRSRSLLSHETLNRCLLDHVETDSLSSPLPTLNRQLMIATTSVDSLQLSHQRITAEREKKKLWVEPNRFSRAKKCLVKNVRHEIMRVKQAWSDWREPIRREREIEARLEREIEEHLRAEMDIGRGRQVAEMLLRIHGFRASEESEEESEEEASVI